MRAITAGLVRTRRLDLVPVAASHAGEMAAVLADPQLYTFTGGHPPTTEELRARYERWNAGSPDPEVCWCNWVIRLRQEECLAGTVQATIGLAAGLVAEVAWVTGTRWQRQGFATEAAQALIDWLARQSVRTVIAHIHPGHLASAGVAARAGLSPTGEMRGGEVRWCLALVKLTRRGTLRTKPAHNRVSRSA